MLRAILYASLLLESLLILSTNGSKLFPNQLHCWTTVYLNNKGNFVNTETDSTNPVDLYQVEEYVDLDSRRSTVSIVDVVRDSTKIYYNQVGPNQFGDRAFTLYHPQLRTCEGQRIADWTLEPLRRVAIELHESISEMRREHVDVSIGPSSLLHAIENNLSRFKFRSRIFSKSKRANVDVYATEIQFETYNGSESVNIIIHLMPDGERTGDCPKNGDTLENVYGKITSQDIALVGACKTGTRDNLESVESELKKKKGDDPNHPIDIQYGEDSFCERENLIFTIHYHIVSLYTPGTLIGRSLDDYSTVTGFNFQLEPFVKPVGIGCLADDVSSRPDWQMRLSGSHVTRLSAEYVSLYGVPGVNYVAYDDHKSLLRWDTAGRKNIYVYSHKSYHISEYSPQSKDQKLLLDRNIADNKVRDVPKCIVLDIAGRTSPIKFGPLVPNQIIGLGRGDDESYMGSRMLDHINYEVFEKEWEDKSKLPIIMRSAKFPGLLPTENKRLFITYYAQNMPRSRLSDVTVPQSDTMVAVEADDEEVLLLSFIEVWEFNTMHKKRRLINRVKFLEFSWDLDIEPANDPESQRSGSAGAQLFNIEPCHQDRASQGEVVVKFTRKPLSGATLQDKLDDDQHVVSYADRYLADAMCIPILNLVDTKAKILDSGEILATSRVVELRNGISTKQSLGLISYKPGNLTDKIVKVVLNRHSHEECRLESISVTSTNVFAYCPNLALCLILKDSPERRSEWQLHKTTDDLLARHKEELSKTEDGVVWDVCAVESFKYDTVDVSRKFGLYDRTVMERAFHFIDREKTRSYRMSFKLKSGTYSVEAIAFKQLDSIGTRLTNDVTLLSNLRYSTKEEEPSSINMNSRVRAKTKMGAFKFCQLACQMDDFCGSFSTCSRPDVDGIEQADCVLSSVRLTGERLNYIIEASTKVGKGEKFLVKLTGETHSQKLIMYPDESCSIHPKDFLAEYHVDGLWKNREKSPLRVTDVQTGKPKVEKRYLDLEDCAGLNFELNGLHSSDPGNTTFTYCPLDSHCITSVDNARSFARNSTAHCYIYIRHSTRAYNVQRMTRMAVTRAKFGSDGQEGEQKAVKLWERLKKFAKKEDGLMFTISWGSSEQKCAYECNMHSSKCLAFDSCRRDDRFLCILYHRRSPMMRESASFPLLRQERAISSEYVAEMKASDICDHYYLKEDYFEVRLVTMLAEEQKHSVVGDFDERQQAIKEVEGKLVVDDKKQSDEIVNSLVGDVKQLEEDEAKDDRQAPSGNQLIHWTSLLVGLFVGAVGILYRQQILEGAGHVHRLYRERRVRSNSMNDLVLDNQNV